MAHVNAFGQLVAGGGNYEAAHCLEASNTELDVQQLYIGIYQAGTLGSHHFWNN